ncbi:hypothetical protein FEI13_18065 [Halomonas urmiana]|uniref:O-antigen ligase family protein n=1 Tax=Halomonas urmiana TaxID=490901 RepID=A0A5R8M7J6_9GAMM|nr:hypothetical protein [Halomonas urmiana]TLF45475.1 hypothetical protein FEI13_18065 [Halomonas urmiana]
MKYQTRTADADSFRGFRYLHGLSYSNVAMLTLFLYLYLLAPYFDLRVMVLHGGMLATAFLLLRHYRLAFKVLALESVLMVFIVLCLFAIYNLVVVAIYSVEFTTAFQTYLIQVCIYLMLGLVLAMSLMQRALDMDQVITLIFKLVTFVVFVNALIIVIEYRVPAFRAIIESMLYLPENSNINYLTREYRLRGIASGGAANLSLFHGMVLVIIQALYIKHKIGVVYTLVASVTIFTSLLFIGRTGILIGFIGIVSFHALNLMMARDKLSLRRLFLYVSLAVIIVLAPPVFSIFFPDNVLAYSISFLYEGIEGLQEEGTTRAIANMFDIPNKWGKLLFGVGAHWGDFTLQGSVDAGYMRMLTALGIPLALAFYCFYAFLAKYLFNLTHYKSVWIVLMIIMFIAEIKEPFIFKGYSARLIWMMIGMGICYASCSPFRSDQRQDQVQAEEGGRASHHET